MNKLELSIMISAITMALTLLLFDIWKIIQTPLSVYGRNHWFSEFFLLICVGYWIASKLGILKTKIVVFCVLLCLILTYGLLAKPVLGIEIGGFFVFALIIGIWLRTKEKIIRIKQ